jgi:hypothetical protein
MPEDMGRERMRAADADRQLAADRLRAAIDEGRLDLHEYDERLQRAYAAKTYGDLDALLADLPAAAAVVPAPAQAPVPAAPAPLDRRAAGVTAAWLAHVWGSWAKAVAFFTLIWAIPLIATGDPVFYWPVFFLGPWGVALLSQTVSGLATGKPREHAADTVFRHRLQTYKGERRQLVRRAIARGDLPADATKEERRQFVADAEAHGDLPPRPRRPEPGNPAIQE